MKSSWYRYAEVGCFTALLCGLVGCDAVKPPDKSVESRAKKSSNYQLIRDFQGMIAAAKKNDEAAILRQMERYLLIKSDFQYLFGDELADLLWPKYRDIIAVDIRKEVSRIFLKRVHAGFDQIDCIRVSTVRPKDTTRGDLALMEAMKRRPDMHTIRLRSKDAELGLRFNGFVYIGERWRALFKTHTYLPAPQKLNTLPVRP
jgi:hypothetical protein